MASIFLKKMALIIMSLLLSMAISAQEISLLTVAPGDLVYDTYGHSALRVNDPSRDIDLVYNYGLYDFNTPGFVMKFMRGKLLYQVGAHRYDSFLFSYNKDKRTVYEQKLNLNQEEKDALMDALRVNMLKENRSYKYDFFFDNCSTRLRDLFENIVENLETNGELRALTYRDLIKEHQYGMPWSDFGIDIIIGSKADVQSSLDAQMFLPIYLKDILSEAKIKRGGEEVNLLSEPYEVISFPREAAQRMERTWFTPELLFLLIGLLLFSIRSRFRRKEYLPKWIVVIDKSILLILALVGCIVAFMWWGTDHVPTKSNWNILWLNPLILLPVFFTAKKNKWLRYIIYLLIGGCLLALFNVWFQFLPQQFHIAFGWINLIQIMIYISFLKWSR